MTHSTTEDLAAEFIERYGLESAITVASSCYAKAKKQEDRSHFAAIALHLLQIRDDVNAQEPDNYVCSECCETFRQSQLTKCGPDYLCGACLDRDAMMILADLAAHGTKCRKSPCEHEAVSGLGYCERHRDRNWLGRDTPEDR